MKRALSRRSLLAGLGGSTAALALAGCSKESGGPSGSGKGEAQQISAFWWGSDSRAQLTNQVFEQFAQEHPGMSVKGQFLAFNNYFDKLATLAAAGSVPDLLQTNPGSLTQYGENGQLLDLATLDLDLGDYQDAARQSGLANGKQYGLAFGYQYVTVFYNADMLEKAGGTVPQDPVSWDDWADFAAQLQGSLPAKTYAMTDSSSDSNSFESWMVGRGKSLFTEDGQLGYDAGDVTDWFDYWTGLRSRGAMAPAADSVTYVQTGAVTDSPVTKGNAAMTLGINVGFQGYQQLNEATLDMAACPVGPAGRCESNHFFGWSVSAKTKVTDAIKAFLEMWFTSTQVVQTVGTDRALPASQTQLEALDKVAEGATARLLKFSIAHPDIKPFSPPSTPATIGNRQTESLRRAAEGVVTGSSKPADAAQKLVQEVQAALKG